MHSRRNIWAYLALGVILGVAIFVRVYHNNVTLFWDEIRLYKEASQPLAEVINEPRDYYPLYYVLAHLSLQLGRAEVFLRLPSIVAGVVLVAAAFFAGRSLYGTTLGLLFAAAIAILDYHVYYSREARFYGVVILTCFLSTWLLAECLKKGGRLKWIAYTVVTFFAALSHLFAVPYLLITLGVAVAFVCAAPTHVFSPRRIRVLASLLVSGAIAFSGFGYVAAVKGESASALLASNESATPVNAEVPRATDVPEPAPTAKENATYRLTVTEYFSYFDDYFFGTTRAQNGAGPGSLHLFLRLYLASLSVAGFAVLWRRHRPLAVLAGGALALLPIPFFFLDVTHWYHSRYFSALTPVLALLATLGVCGGAARVVNIRRRIADERGGRREQTRALGLLYPGLSVIAIGPWLWFSAENVSWQLTEGVAHRHVEPWKETMQYMARKNRPQDIVVQARDKSFSGQKHEWEYSLFGIYYNFYARRYFRNPQRHSLEQERIIGALEPGDITRILHDNPERTVWVLNENPAFLPPAVEQELARWAPRHRAFGDLRVWVIGEPTVNLFPMGDFEGEDALAYFGRIERDRPFGLAGGPGVYEGKAALFLQQTGRAPSHLEVAFAPAQRPLRNRDFDLWENGIPVGWRMGGEGARTIRRGEGSRPESGALTFANRQAPAHAAQALPQWRPGMTLRAHAWALAHDNRLSLELGYTVDGEYHRAESPHPPTGRWDTSEVEAQMPQEADAGTGILRIACAPADGPPATIDALRLEVTGATTPLDSTALYTLSFMVKHRGVSRYEDKAAVAIVSILPGGKRSYRIVHEFKGSRDWHFVSIPIIPDRDLTPGAETAGLSVQLNNEGSQLWLDNVQFEEKPYATPVARGAKPPHDEVR